MKVKIYSFGSQDAKTLLLLPGTCCHWKSNFGHVIPLLMQDYHVLCVSYDGFDETERTEFPTMLEETEKIEKYIREQCGGRIHGAYGCSLGGSFVGLLAPRHIVAVSPGEVPWNDAEKARMQALNDKDVSIDYAFMTLVEKFMRHGQENVPDYMISGSRGDFSGVGDIHFFYSADEVLYGALPDFETACQRAHVPHTAFAWPGMVHCYCMLPYFKEAKEDFGKITAILRK